MTRGAASGGGSGMGGAGVVGEGGMKLKSLAGLVGFEEPWVLWKEFKLSPGGKEKLLKRFGWNVR